MGMYIQDEYNHHHRIVRCWFLYHFKGMLDFYTVFNYLPTGNEIIQGKDTHPRVKSTFTQRSIPYFISLHFSCSHLIFLYHGIISYSSRLITASCRNYCSTLRYLTCSTT